MWHGFLQLKFFKLSTDGLSGEGCILRSPQEESWLLQQGSVYLRRCSTSYFGATRITSSEPGNLLADELLTYDPQTLAAMDFLQKDAQPGDVVLPGDNLIAPVLALTKCRVPVGYFSYRFGGTKRLHAQGDCGKEVLERLAIGKSSRTAYCSDANVRYIVVNKQTEGLPATIPGQPIKGV